MGSTWMVSLELSLATAKSALEMNKMLLVDAREKNDREMVSVYHKAIGFGVGEIAKLERRISENGGSTLHLPDYGD